MIVEIIKTPSCRGIIEYNEAKVGEGVATRIHDTTLSGHPGTIKSIFESNACKNQHLRNNRFQHVIISFHKNDEVSPAQFMNIWEDYASEMNYNHFNQVIYQHHDTYLNHYHVVMPTVDLLGKKFKDYQDFIQNRDTCRLLESKYDLHRIVYQGFTKRQQHAMNADQFSVYNFVKRKHLLIKHQIHLGASFLSTIRKYKLTNQQIAEHYPSNTNIDFNDLKKLADSFIQSHKADLINTLRRLRNESTNYTTFKKRVNAEGLYIRKLTDPKGGIRMVYGNKQTGTYMKNTKLPKDLRYEYLFQPEKKSFTIEDQARFLRNIAIRMSKQSESFEQYCQLLANYNIEIETKANKNGIYAYSLRSQNVYGSEFIPASKIASSLTLGKLSFHSGKRKNTKTLPVLGKKEIRTALKVEKILNLDYESERQQRDRNS